MSPPTRYAFCRKVNEAPIALAIPIMATTGSLRATDPESAINVPAANLVSEVRNNGLPLTIATESPRLIVNDTFSRTGIMLRDVSPAIRRRRCLRPEPCRRLVRGIESDTLENSTTLIWPPSIVAA